MLGERRRRKARNVSVRKSVAHSEEIQLIQRKWRMLERVQGVTVNMHKQVAADLCRSSGTTILLPALPVGKMVEKIDTVAGKLRKIRGKTAQHILSLKHASFRSFLKHKVLMTGCELAIVGEPYTTITC